MAAIDERKQAGDFIRSDSGPLSFDKVTFRIGEVLVPGQVVGKLASGGQYGALEEAATNGLATPAGICFDHVDTTSAAKAGTIVARAAEVVSARLTWPGSYNDSDKAAAALILENKLIVIRS